MTEKMGEENLYSIGALSKIVKVSTDTLRYYDEIDLVKPAVISEQTGYRYYSDSQASTIARILELKQYGFSLGGIKEILANEEALLIEIYRNRYFDLIREKQNIQEVINKISLRIRQIQEGMYMDRSILLVDDAAFMRMMCKDMLSKEGYKIVDEAVNGVEAVEKLKNLTPDMVLLDIVMPEMHGIEALKRIKEINGDIKAVMCSAMGQPGMVIESLLLGALDFVVKPFQSERLVAAVNGAFNEERIFNKETLSRLMDKLANNKNILSQSKIDGIIKCALVDNPSVQDIDELLDKVGSNSNHNADNVIMGKFESDRREPVSNNAEINEHEILRMLDKIARGQEEIKELLIQALTPRND